MPHHENMLYVQMLNSIRENDFGVEVIHPILVSDVASDEHFSETGGEDLGRWNARVRAAKVEKLRVGRLLQGGRRVEDALLGVDLRPRALQSPPVPRGSPR